MEKAKQKKEIAIELNEQLIVDDKKKIKFEIDQFRKKCLLEGLDDIALTLDKKSKIKAYENKIKENLPWL